MTPILHLPLLGFALAAVGSVAIVAYTRLNRPLRTYGATMHWVAGFALAAPGMGLIAAGWVMLCLSQPRVRLPAAHVVGALVGLLALGIYAASARRVGRWRTPTRYSLGLHTSGIYERVRHPQALSLCVTVVGLTLLSGSVPYLVTAPVWIAFWVGYTYMEERWELIPTFGEDYLRYRERVPRLIPRKRRRRPS